MKSNALPLSCSLALSLLFSFVMPHKACPAYLSEPRSYFENKIIWALSAGSILRNKGYIHTLFLVLVVFPQVPTGYHLFPFHVLRVFSFSFLVVQLCVSDQKKRCRRKKFSTNWLLMQHVNVDHTWCQMSHRRKEWRETRERAYHSFFVLALSALF